jgi:hypothetical protein
MNDDVLVRLLVVGFVVAAAILAAWLARRGAAVVRRPVRLEGLGPGVVLFSSSTCGTCEVMRRRLTWANAVEVSYEGAAADFPDAVRRVPAVALLDSEGRGWIAYGVVGESRLRRWVEEGSLDS